MPSWPSFSTSFSHRRRRLHCCKALKIFNICPLTCERRAGRDNLVQRYAASVCMSDDKSFSSLRFSNSEKLQIYLASILDNVPVSRHFSRKCEQVWLNTMYSYLVGKCVPRRSFQLYSKTFKNIVNSHMLVPSRKQIKYS